MGDAPEEKKEGGETITIRVKDQTGEETYFKVKKTTKMDK
jgi:small ubiquitin-related modifier